MPAVEGLRLPGGLWKAVWIWGLKDECVPAPPAVEDEVGEVQVKGGHRLLWLSWLWDPKG